MICVECGKEFKEATPWNRYCSKECKLRRNGSVYAYEKPSDNGRTRSGGSRKYRRDELEEADDKGVLI